MKSSTSYVTSSVLVGLLNQEGGSCHNLINVISLAKESGITVSNQKHSPWRCVQPVFILRKKLTLPLAGQINQGHCMVDSGASGVCKVEIVAGGCSYAAEGAVQGGVPVLLKLNNSVYRQPVCLAGHLLLFKASANPQLLSSVAGKKVSCAESL